MILLQGATQLPPELTACLGKFFFPWVFLGVLSIITGTAGFVAFLYRINRDATSSQRDYHKVAAEDCERKLDELREEVKRLESELQSARLTVAGGGGEAVARSLRFKQPFVAAVVFALLMTLVTAGLFLRSSSSDAKNRANIVQLDHENQVLKVQLQPLTDTFGSAQRQSVWPSSDIQVGRKSVSEAFDAPVLIWDVAGKTRRATSASKSAKIIVTFRQ